MSDNIFEKGCLCNLDVGIWGARVKIPKEKIKVEADKSFWSAAMRLVDPKTLKTIEGIRNEARAFLLNNSLPFPIRGIAFVPKDKASAIEDNLRTMQIKFDREVTKFCADYTVFREQAKDHLGDLYDETAYPPNIEKKFSFGWQFFAVGMENGSKVLSPAVYEREKAKFEQQMSDFAENAVATLRLRFLEMLDHIVTRLAGGNQRVFRDSLLETPKKFIEDFQALNICDDKAMEAMVKKVGALLDGVNPDMLRDDVAFRASVANQVAQVEIELAKVIKETPSRMLDIDWDTPEETAK